MSASVHIGDSYPYELLEDVPANATRVLSQSGRTNATRSRDGRWYHLDSSLVPLDARGPWRVVQCIAADNREDHP